MYPYFARRVVTPVPNDGSSDRTLMEGGVVVLRVSSEDFGVCGLRGGWTRSRTSTHRGTPFDATEGLRLALRRDEFLPYSFGLTAWPLSCFFSFFPFHSTLNFFLLFFFYIRRRMREITLTTWVARECVHKFSEREILDVRWCSWHWQHHHVRIVTRNILCIAF